MELKLYNLKNPSKDSNPIGKIIIKHKEIIRTISLDDNYICNGKSLNSDFRTDYKLDFFDKYHKNYKYSEISIKYIIRSGTSFTAFIKPNFLQKVYLKSIWSEYPIQKIEGGLRTIFEVIGFIITIIVTWYTSKC